jgi:hypothetical protein
VNSVIQTPFRGVLSIGKAMNALAAGYAEIAVNSGDALEREPTRLVVIADKPASSEGIR